LAAAGIIHFVVSAALVQFPAAVLAAPRNWLFIGLHFLLGTTGFVLMGIARKKKPVSRPLPEPLSDRSDLVQSCAAPPSQGADEEDDSDTHQDAHSDG